MSNKGDVLGCAKRAVAELYGQLPLDPQTGKSKVSIDHVTVTGYGEALLTKHYALTRVKLKRLLTYVGQKKCFLGLSLFLILVARI